MKKGIGLGIALVAIALMVGCKPMSREVTSSETSTDVANLKTDVQDMSNQLSDLQTSVTDIRNSLDSLTNAFVDHMKKFHSTTITIPRPITPTTGGTGTPTRRQIK